MLTIELGEAALDKWDFYNLATSLQSCCLYYEDWTPQPQFIDTGGMGTSYTSEEALLCMGVAQVGHGNVDTQNILTKQLMQQELIFKIAT